MPALDERLPAFMSSQVAEARRFYVPASLQDAQFGVVSGGWEYCASDYRIDRAGFVHPTFEVVTAGKGILRFANSTVVLERGVLFTYGPRVAHAIETDPSHRLTKYFINLGGRGALQLMRQAGMAPGRALALNVTEEAQAVLDLLVSAGQRGTAHALTIAGLQARILMLLVSEVRLPVRERANPSRKTFVRCREYIDTHFLKLYSVAEVAKACGVTLPHLSRMFRRFAGQTPYQFLMRLKMAHAAALLQHHELNVSEAADALGMDPFHLSRVFKRIHGRAPSSFIPPD